LQTGDFPLPPAGHEPEKNHIAQVLRQAGQQRVDLREELREHYDDGKWDREKFTAKHILFPERDDGYDYLAEIFQKHRGVAGRQACPQTQ
jgi:hypothetical protein